jgi:hypothetical protein
LDSIVEAMARVFHGKNQGIQLVRLSPEAGLSLLHNET